jgi:hypothetical protein
MQEESPESSEELLCAEAVGRELSSELSRCQ